ncbi:transporter [Ammoniphilus oxalaticus]|uniref:Transporter n=1 Tax=Ammoniphilus oxalaticus TaxID=66863 RepID=A0A419SF00_9BACL|nr:EamA family transporter [Ammoniphilus oxalaticus]RKD21837.1 transporter [Ammoniphilus oxalaticus]
MSRGNNSKGFTLVITAALLWGMSGAVAQKLFQQYHIEVNWLVTSRLLIAGFLLLIVQFKFRDRAQIFNVWRQPRSAIQLLIFALFGTLAVQYTYMAAIDQGNAAVGTLLQYLAPALIILYLILRKQSALNIRDTVSVSLALIGCFLLLTDGAISKLSVPPMAIVWGLLSAVALAFYTLYPVRLLKKFDSIVIVGWAMVIGGLVLNVVHPIWKMDVSRLTLSAWGYLFFVVVLGTMIAFWFYIESLQSLAPKETSLLSSLEPLAAVLSTVFWLGEPFGPFQWLGSACMMIMLIFVAVNQGTSVTDKKTDATRQVS